MYRSDPIERFNRPGDVDVFVYGPDGRLFLTVHGPDYQVAHARADSVVDALNREG